MTKQNHVVFECKSNEAVAVAESTLLSLMNDGKIFKQLIWGGDNMGKLDSPNLAVCRKFKVTASELLGIIAIVGGCSIRDDDRLRRLAKTGDLREAAEKLGGFSAIDNAFIVYKAEQRAEKVASLPRSPECKGSEQYDWSLVIVDSRVPFSHMQDMLSECKRLKSYGYEFASIDKRKEIYTYFLHFRRKK